MGKESHKPNPYHPPLSRVLSNLRMHLTRIHDDTNRVIGMIDNIHQITDPGELIVRLKTILGRERMTLRYLRQYMAYLEPLEYIIMSLEGRAHGQAS